MLARVALVIFKMVKVFLVPVMLAVVFAGIFYSLYRWLLVHTRQWENLSTLICCVQILACLVPAVNLIAHLMSREAGDFSRMVRDWLVPLIQ